MLAFGYAHRNRFASAHRNTVYESMDTERLKTVGQIAGIGGIALGVFLLLIPGADP